MPQEYYKLLLEDGSYLLQEDSGKINLESNFSDTSAEQVKGRIEQTRTVYL
jgi:hypothetical protein